MEPEPAFCDDCGVILENGPPCGICTLERDGTLRAYIEQIRGPATEGPSQIHVRELRSVRENRPRRNLKVE